MERRENTLYNWPIHNSWRRLCLSTSKPSQGSAPPEGTSDRWHSSFGSRSYSSPGEQCPVARWCTWGWGNENRMWVYDDLLELSNQGITFTNHHKPIWACLPTNLNTSRHLPWLYGHAAACLSKRYINISWPETQANHPKKWRIMGGSGMIATYVQNIVTWIHQQKRRQRSISGRHEVLLVYHIIAIPSGELT